MNKKYYVTTAIDYANDVVHIGHSYQKILADVLARYYRLQNFETYFLTGTDEHGQKVENKAKEKGVEPKKFVDETAKQDEAEWKALNISFDRFIRTTDDDHIKFAQEFYLKSKANGDIYLDKYEGLYCEGCEAYLNESDLIDGKCPFHPNREPIKISESNYFFRLSKYQEFLENLIENNPEFVQPESKRKEVLSFVKAGLKDFSVSRQNVTWGIPVPDDTKHTIYVWFDALINYLTYGVEKNCWPADVHILGKDNQRFHAIYWPAMLKSAGYPLPKTILVHDFMTLNGQKISKSLENVIRPTELIRKLGVDGVRYYFLRYGPLVNDVDISLEKIKDSYNSDLANGLGNLVARVARLCETNNVKPSKTTINNFDKLVSEAVERYRVDWALEEIWKKINSLDILINQHELWKDTKKKILILADITESIRQIAYDLKPFLPETAEKIEKQFAGPKIKSEDALFPRIK